MAIDNTTLNTMTGGDVIRDVNRGGVKTQVVALDAGDGQTEALVGPQNPLPVHEEAFDEAQSGEKPLGAFIVGDPNGPYAGMDMLGGVISGNAAFSTNPNLKKDSNDALMLSDGVTFTGSTAGINQAVTGVIDTSGYNTFEFIVSGGVGTGSIQTSVDGTQWTTGFYSLGSSTYSANSTSITVAPQSGYGPIRGKYCRYNVSAYTSGNISVTIVLRTVQTHPVSPTQVLNSQLTNSTGSGMPAESAAIGSMPVILVGGKVRTALVAATLIDDDACRLTFSDSAGVVIEPHAIPQLTWNYAAAAAGILNTTTAVTIKAAVAGQRGCLSSIQLQHEPLGAATEFVIRDGAAGTVMWRIKLPLTTAKEPITVVFDPPLRQAAVNVLMEIATLTASVTGAVYFNASGYLSN